MKNIVNVFKLLKSPESELLFTTGLAIKMAHTKTSADNSFALSTQTSYEMHKKTIVQILATYARTIYNVHCGKSNASIVHNLYSQ